MVHRNACFSDISGEVVLFSEAVKLIVHDHPLIEQPVVLDVSRREAGALEVEADEYVILELVDEAEENSQRAVIKQEAFDKVFKTTPVDEVLHGAARYRTAGPTRSAGDRINYRVLPNAGMPHRGRTTEDEAAVVRANLTEVNRNRTAAGHPPIDPTNERDAARYGFEVEPVRPRPRPV